MEKVYEAIKNVMSDIEYIEKDKLVSFQNTKYKAVTEEAVTRSVRKSLIKNNLIIIPSEQEHERVGDLTTVNVKYRIINTEDGSEVTVESSGTGVDKQDKGVGKAMTYAYKYMLLRTFAIPTGNDPDYISSDELTYVNNEDKRKKAVKELKEKCLIADININKLSEKMNLKSIDDITENMALYYIKLIEEKAIKKAEDNIKEN